MTAERPWRAAPGGLLVSVRLTPKGGADRIDGIAADGAGRPLLLARVSAPPAEGAANDALRRMLAKAAGTPRSAVTFVTGETARVKRLRIEGDPAALAAALETAAARRR